MTSTENQIKNDMSKLSSDLRRVAGEKSSLEKQVSDLRMQLAGKEESMKLLTCSTFRVLSGLSGSDLDYGTWMRLIAAFHEWKSLHREPDQVK